MLKRLVFGIVYVLLLLPAQASLSQIECPEPSDVMLVSLRNETSPPFDYAYVCRSGEIHYTEANFGVISPSCDLSAAIDYTTTPFELVITTLSQPDQRLRIPFKHGWFDGDLRWTDNEHIALSLFEEENTYAGRVLIHLQSGKIQTLAHSIPDTVESLNYSSDLRYVAYAFYGYGGIQLYTMETANNQELWHVDLNHSHLFNVWMEWSPKNQQLAFNDSSLEDVSGFVQEIFVWNASGGKKQVSNLTNKGASASIVRSLKWSPDEKYIAFWWTSLEIPILQDIPSYSLTILEIETGQIQTFDIKRKATEIGEMIWSPSSDAIAMVAKGEDESWHVYMANLDSGSIGDVVGNVVELKAWCELPLGSATN